MAHHAYFITGDTETGIEAALHFSERELGMSLTGNPDIIIERYGLFSVEDARRVAAKAGLSPVRGDQKVFIIAAGRLFHEAQNAMLKLFEEPPAGTILMLVVPSEGNLLPTLRSRLQPLETEPGVTAPPLSEEVATFVAGTAAAREHLVAKILDDAKSDKDEEKQEARGQALRLAEGLSRAGYAAWRSNSANAELMAFLRDLDRLIPILHDRAAPLKPILEHILITAPKKIS